MSERTVLRARDLLELQGWIVRVNRTPIDGFPNAAARYALALQLPFCFEVRSLSGSLVSSAPE